MNNKSFNPWKKKKKISTIKFTLSKIQHVGVEVSGVPPAGMNDSGLKPSSADKSERRREQRSPPQSRPSWSKMTLNGGSNRRGGGGRGRVRGSEENKIEEVAWSSGSACVVTAHSQTCTRETGRSCGTRARPGPG